MKQFSLIIRFAMELCAIVTFGIFGYSLGGSPLNIALAILFPLLFSILWGVFAVKDDPSRSGKTVIHTPGLFRLVLELALFSSAIYMLFKLEYTLTAWFLLAGVILHYSTSLRRIRWLLDQK